MSFILYFQTSAYQDLTDAYNNLEDYEIGRGISFLNEIDSMVQRIEENPFLFQKVFKDKRCAIIKKYNYHLIYQVEEKESLVRVITVVYGKSNPKRWEMRK